jgi:hypothetical protein
MWFDMYTLYVQKARGKGPRKYRDKARFREPAIARGGQLEPAIERNWNDSGGS